MGLFNKKVQIKFKEQVNPIYESETYLKQIQKAYEDDKIKTEKLDKNLTEEEKSFINYFVDKSKPFCKKYSVIYNFRSGNINFEINGMQIGRISLNNKKREMQILTKDDVKWIRPISYDEAIKNTDKWIKYMKYLLK